METDQRKDRLKSQRKTRDRTLKLKAMRRTLNREIRKIDADIRHRIERAGELEGRDQANELDTIERLTADLNEMRRQHDAISLAVEALPDHPKKKSRRKPHKIHDVSGRSIAPSSFIGVVSGGTPGLGKRR